MMIVLPNRERERERLQGRDGDWVGYRERERWERQNDDWVECFHYAK